MDLLTQIEQLISNIQELIKIAAPGFDLKIGYLTIFSHSNSQYEELIEELGKLGKRQEANNGYRFELFETLSLLNEDIKMVRIRKPDVHRPELGCCDLIYQDYGALRSLALDRGMDIIIRKDYEMIELSTFDIPVYAYALRQSPK